MLNSSGRLLSVKSFSALLSSVLVCLILVSCVPQSQSPGVNRGNSTDSNSPVPAVTYQEPTFPLNGIFIQDGANRTMTQFSLPVTFKDSFLIRGLGLSKYLRKLPNTTKMCVVGKYAHVPGADKFILMAAKPKSFTDLINKTTEFYLQVEPANDAANQNDCLTYNLSTVLINSAASPTLSFGLTQLCSNCTSTITSSPLKLFFNNGEEVPGMSLGAVVMTVTGSESAAVNSCVESTLCQARGFNCCLQGQCVKDGAIRPGALTDPDFMIAQQDVSSNPGRFVVYPQFYFVCESRPEENPQGTNTSTPSTDPNYSASIRMMELTHLFQCLNPVEGEFSHCTVKFSGAKDLITAGPVSPAALGVKDDVNFASLNANYASSDMKNNIVKVLYGGKVLYELKKTPLTDASFVANTHNDDLLNVQSINITSGLPSNAQDDNLYITYKIDGTCEKLGVTLAKCSKTYIQSSSDVESTTWHDNSKVYLLPHYADLSPSSSVIVKIGGIVVPEDASTWSRASSPNRIIFNGSYNIYQNQKIEITYFVSSYLDEVVKSRSAAQLKVNSMCTCAGGAKCNLRPIHNDANAVINYECSYPVTGSDLPPVNQTVFVSNKNVPHRYFDVNGVSYDTDYSNALAQEGLAFGYTNNDTLKPTNANGYVGFNEIYGSFAKSGTYVARSAKYARVKKDQLYDIIVSSGVYSSCQTCGSDYYSAIQKIFPQNFAGAGGGYTPDYYSSSREGSSSLYRSDDLLYGRACFLPATMIPWTHVAGTDPTSQRRTRLAGQHFLYANGYNRDWFGFDYGSVIGSFDGITWFSIGNQRRIKASSGKLFLAVNAYFGDLSLDNNFNVVVSETSTFSSPIPTHDSESDGAECQRAHYCSTDRDCFANLGYDYTCQNVAGLMTQWPQVDALGSEVVGSVTKTLASIVGGTNGQSKRCVYRGRGAPCHSNLSNTNSSFNSSSLNGTLSCSSNNFCMATNTASFNDKIARFANTPLAQNLAAVSTPPSDIVGLGARIIGRPFDYYGSKLIPPSAALSLSPNNVNGVCIPGKDVAGATTTFGLNSLAPSYRPETSDKILGIGATLSGLVADPKFLSACPATDELGNSVHLQDLTLASDERITKYTRSQNLSTNHLNLTPIVTAGIYSVSGTTQVSKVGYQRNACLRAAGASCFSDMDCGPSNFIANKFKSASGLDALLNEAEKKFWQEELICGNPEYKLVNNGEKNVLFDVKKNRCCRDIGKTLTVYTEAAAGSEWEWCNTTPTPDEITLAGVNIPVNSKKRYSRVQTAYDKFTCGTPSVSTPFALSLKATDELDRMLKVRRQYNTLDAINSRTCCTQHWVRSFHKDNGGGHAFDKAKTQSYNVEMFREVNWYPQNDFVLTDPTLDDPFKCANDGVNHATSACEIRNFTDADGEKILKFAASLELVGIPQVAIKTNDEIYKIVDESQLGLLTKEPLNYTVKPVSGNGDFIDESGNRYYSASNYAQFEAPIRKIFSEEEFSCCQPAGKELTDSTTASQCCTGFIATNAPGRRCCLPDFTDVTVYLNRYVSSEGRGLPDNAYDPDTGYIKDPAIVQQIAAQKNLCCSGTTITGFALSNLHIPLKGTNGETLFIPGLDPRVLSKRFIYRTDAIDNNSDTNFIGDLFNAGLKWNNHVYCVRNGFSVN